MKSTLRSIAKRAKLVATLCFIVIGCAFGCNTTEGVGEDIESAGEAIEEAADDAND